MPNRPPKTPQAPPPSFRPARGPITGLDVARASGARVVIGVSGDSPCYAWRFRTIVLPPEVAMGTDMASLLIAAEEAAHHAQPRWLHAIRFIGIARWFEEADCFIRVKRFFGSLRSTEG